MKVLVTGATGFIGQHVVPQLLERGCTVTAVARDERKARGFAWFDRVKFIACDIHSGLGNSVNQFLQSEVVIHLAWSGLPNYGALFHFEENLPADYRFLRTLVQGGVERLLVTGTCFEYGMQSGPLREDMETRPTNPYGFAKDTLRRQLEYLKFKQSFSLIWARLFYLHGDGQPENSLLPQLKASVKRNDRIFNMSGGEQLRDYLPVSEAANFLVSLAMRNQSPGIVNVCSGKPISVRTLVDHWITDNDWSIIPNLGHYPYSSHEAMAFWGDRQKLDRLLASR